MSQELTAHDHARLQALVGRMNVVVETVRDWAETQSFYRSFNREWGPRHHGFELTIEEMTGLLDGQLPTKISFPDRKPRSAMKWISEFERLVRISEEEIQGWMPHVEKTN